MQGGAVVENASSLTEQLQRLTAGDYLIADETLRSILPELHRIALRALARTPGDQVCATELINEFWLRKLTKGTWRIENRQHFYALAGFAMRQVLIELARQQKAGRRGGDSIMLPLDQYTGEIGGRNAEADSIIHLGMLMDRLEEKNAKAARIVDLHYFVGFTLPEISEITGLTLRKVRYLWHKGSNSLKDGLIGP